MKGITDTCAEASADACVNISVTARTCARDVSFTRVIISFVTGITALSANGVLNAVERFVNFYNKRQKKKAIHITDDEGST